MLPAVVFWVFYIKHVSFSILFAQKFLKAGTGIPHQHPKAMEGAGPALTDVNGGY